MNGHDARHFAQVDPLAEGGWRVVVPVRVEDVTVSKRTIVYEEVDIRRELVEDVMSHTEPLRHEEIDVGAGGDVLTERLPEH